MCYYASYLCFSEKSLFIAEAISPQLKASIIVSFVLLDTLIHTDSPSKTRWRLLSKTIIQRHSTPLKIDVFMTTSLLCYLLLVTLLSAGAEQNIKASASSEDVERMNIRCWCTTGT